MGISEEVTQMIQRLERSNTRVFEATQLPYDADEHGYMEMDEEEALDSNNLLFFCHGQAVMGMMDAEKYAGKKGDKHLQFSLSSSLDFREERDEEEKYVFALAVCLIVRKALKTQYGDSSAKRLATDGDRDNRIALQTYKDLRWDEVFEDDDIEEDIFRDGPSHETLATVCMDKNTAYNIKTLCISTDGGDMHQFLWDRIVKLKRKLEEEQQQRWLKEAQLAACMGSHKRMGEGSHLKMLDALMVSWIAKDLLEDYETPLAQDSLI